LFIDGIHILVGGVKIIRGGQSFIDFFESEFLFNLDNMAD